MVEAEGKGTQRQGQTSRRVARAVSVESVLACRVCSLLEACIYLLGIVKGCRFIHRTGTMVWGATGVGRRVEMSVGIRRTLLSCRCHSDWPLRVFIVI